MSSYRLKLGLVLLVLVLACASSSAGILYVNRGATGAEDGSSWGDAFLRIGDAIYVSAPGDEIWVARGTYVENVQLPDGVGLFGGFAGTETERSGRNPAVNLTSIDAGRAGRAVRFADGAGPQTVLDGFRIRNGRPDVDGGGGAMVEGGSPVISNNVFSENIANQGAGIVVRNAAPTIANNLFHDNTALFGAAINIYQNDPGTLSIVNNTFVNNHSGEGGFVIGMQSYANVLFANNLVAYNDRQIYLAYNDSSATYLNNNAWENSTFNYFGPDPTGTDGNISVEPVFQNGAYGNFRLGPGSPAINAGTNTAVIGSADLDNLERVQDTTVDIGAYENSGTAYHLVFVAQPATSRSYTLLNPQPILQVEDNTGQPVPGYSGPVTLAIDPGSGGLSATLSGTTTVNAVDGVATFTDLSVDGAGNGFVLDATTVDTLPQQSLMFDVVDARLYVSKSGLDSNDGLSWTTAKLTVQAAIDAAATEVWVAEGTYSENLTIQDSVALYGGFAGTESALGDRDLNAHVTILDGSGIGRVITSTAGWRRVVRVIDGFTIRNGVAPDYRGGGASIRGFNGTITDTLFAANTSGTDGGGLCIEPDGPDHPLTITLTRVTFAGNVAAQGGGLFLDARVNAVATVALNQCVISGNTALSGGGAYLIGDQSLYQCQFLDNTASLGGGLYQMNTTSANLCVFSGNGITASPMDAAGGAVFSGENAGLQASNSQFTGNHVSAVPGKSAAGGAWAATQNGSIYAYNCAMTANTAAIGGAIYGRRAGNITLVLCRTTNNTATASGGAISVALGPISMTSCLIANNSAGTYGGALALDTAPVGHDQSNQVYLLNTTITGNTAPAGGAAIDNRNYSQMRLVNNVIAWNGSGIQQDPMSLASFFNNDVFGNGVDFQGLPSPIGTFGNIAVDPQFVNRASDDYHLASGSPCVDAGDSGPYNWYQQDQDSNPRVRGARVDIGAYERSGTGELFLYFEQNVPDLKAPGLLVPQPVVRIVNINGAPQMGYSGSVTVALKAGYGTTAATLGGTTTVPVVDGVATFTNLAVDKGGTEYYLTASIPGHGGADLGPFNVYTPDVRVSPTGSDRNDGSSWASPKRTLQWAMNQAASGGAVWVKAGYYPGLHQLPRSYSVLGGFAGTESSPEQRNPKANVVTLDGLGLGSIFSSYGEADASPTYDGITFTNGGGYGGGIIVYSGSAVISNNTFSGGVTVFGGGVLTFSPGVQILRNRFVGNSAQWGGGGVYIANAAGVVLDSNLFTGNSNQNQDGSAITAWNSPFVCTNNTIVSNVGTGGAVGIQDSAATIVNNIIANNGSGLIRNDGATATLVLNNNDVFNNAGFDYKNMTAGPNSLAVDPLFAGAASGDYHLTAASPVLDKGDDSVLSPGALDLDLRPRLQGAHVDMGAFEYYSAMFTLADVQRALRIELGGVTADAADLSRLNVVDAGTSAGKIDVRDASLLARKLAGLDANP